MPRVETIDRLVGIGSLAIRLKRITYIVHHGTVFRMNICASVGGDNAVTFGNYTQTVGDIVGLVVSHYAIDHQQLGISYITITTWIFTVDIDSRTLWSSTVVNHHITQLVTNHIDSLGCGCRSIGNQHTTTGLHRTGKGKIVRISVAEREAVDDGMLGIDQRNHVRRVVFISTQTRYTRNVRGDDRFGRTRITSGSSRTGQR